MLFDNLVNRILFLENDVNFRELLKDRRGDTETNVPKFVYHATREKNIQSIMRNGIIPKQDNLQDVFPEPRVYLTFDEISALKIAKQLRDAIIYRKGEPKKWIEDYVILKIETDKLSNVFFIDPYFFGGLYTKESIPAETIKIQNKINGNCLLNKNWKKFWDWKIWGKEKPDCALDIDK